MNRLSNFLFYSVCIAAGFLIAQQIYAVGFVTGYLYERDTSYVKNRIIRKGNIIQYPFREEGGEAPQTSDSNCNAESGQEQEKEGA